MGYGYRLRASAIRAAARVRQAGRFTRHTFRVNLPCQPAPVATLAILQPEMPCPTTYRLRSYEKQPCKSDGNHRNQSTHDGIVYAAQPPNRHGGGRASSAVGSAPLRRLLLALPPSWPRSRRYPFALLGLRGAFAVSLLAVLRFPSMRPPRVSQGTMIICNVRCFFLALLSHSVPSGFGSAFASCPRVGRSGFVIVPLR